MLVPQALRDRLRDAVLRTPVWSASKEGRPVAFAYAAHTTEAWFDLSVDTLEDARNQGLGRAAAMGLIVDRMLRGLRPVWCAAEEQRGQPLPGPAPGIRAGRPALGPHPPFMIKVELHAHTSDDPGDRVPHHTPALLEHAARFGYGALAITLHNRWFDPAPFAERAAALGIVLMSGIEKTIDGKHLLLINVPREATTCDRLTTCVR